MMFRKKKLIFFLKIKIRQVLGGPKCLIEMNSCPEYCENHNDFLNAFKWFTLTDFNPCDLGQVK